VGAVRDGGPLRPPDCFVWRLGVREYGDALELQRRLARARMAGAVPDLLLLVEHPPVVTLGRGARPEHLLATPTELRRRGVGLFAVERGGDVTYHGPGQLVGYPILDLAAKGGDAHEYLRTLERMLVEWLQGLGVEAFGRKGLTGVWTRSGKIASIGVALRRWVTYHGFCVNLKPDLEIFGEFDPCGIRDLPVTDVFAETGREIVATPAQLGLPYEDLHLKTSDGISLHGWFVPAAQARESAQPRARAQCFGLDRVPCEMARWWNSVEYQPLLFRRDAAERAIPARAR